MKKPKLKPLPNKLYQLLRLAVTDAQRVMKMKNFTLDMGNWVAALDDKAKQCSVCLAGSVMVCELKAHKNKDLKVEGEVTPGYYNVDISSKLHAINDMREGQMVQAFNEINKRVQTNAEQYVLQLVGDLIADDYDEGDERASWETYLQVADILELCNL